MGQEHDRIVAGQGGRRRRGARPAVVALQLELACGLGQIERRLGAADLLQAAVEELGKPMGELIVESRNGP